MVESVLHNLKVAGIFATNSRPFTTKCTFLRHNSLFVKNLLFHNHFQELFHQFTKLTTQAILVVSFDRWRSTDDPPEMIPLYIQTSGIS